MGEIRYLTRNVARFRAGTRVRVLFRLPACLEDIPEATPGGYLEGFPAVNSGMLSCRLPEMAVCSVLDGPIQDYLIFASGLLEDNVQDSSTIQEGQDSVIPPPGDNQPEVEIDRPILPAEATVVSDDDDYDDGYDENDLVQLIIDASGATGILESPAR